MKNTPVFSLCLFIAICFTAPLTASAADTITLLPKPQTDGGKPLMQALKLRQSGRSFTNKKLSSQQLSNLLWAANGINRPGDGKHTAPSAMNWQEVSVYAALENGLYLYDAKKHALVLVNSKDLRTLTGKQPFVKDAALNLIYVADYTRMGKTKPEEKDVYSAADTAFISQNVYLYCASEGLATVVRAYIDKEPLAKEMKLSKDQKIILAQTVGYAK